MDQEQVDQLVATGVTRLDEHFGGRDWVDRINWVTLDMKRPRSCVLGQLFEGGYESALPLLGLAPCSCCIEHDGQLTAQDCGFALEGLGVMWSQLTKSWMRFAE